jgi:hypothetical protein
MSEKRKIVLNGEADLQKILSGPSQNAGSATFIQTSAQSVSKILKRKKSRILVPALLQMKQLFKFI